MHKYINRTVIKLSNMLICISISFHAAALGSGNPPHNVTNGAGPVNFISGDEFTVRQKTPVQQPVQPYIYQGQSESTPPTTRRRIASKHTRVSANNVYDDILDHFTYMI